MAGEILYIQPILKNLLDGIDTSLGGMEQKMQDVVDGVGALMGDPDTPGQHSNLADVVNQLLSNQAATALLLVDVQTKLDSQIAELQRVVTASATGVTKINATAAVESITDYKSLPCPEITPSTSSISKTYTVKSYANGFIRIKRNKNLTPWHKNAGQWSGANSTFTFTVKDGETSVPLTGVSTVSYGLNIAGDDTIDFSFPVEEQKIYSVKFEVTLNQGYGGTTDNFVENYYAMQYGLINVTAPGSALDITNVG